MRFKARIDGWYHGLFIAGILFIMFSIYSLWIDFQWTMLLMAVLYGILYIVLFIPQYGWTYYEIKDRNLWIHSGWTTHLKIPLKRIDALKPPTKQVQSVGFSKKKIMIVYKEGSHAYGVAVCPVDMEGFKNTILKLQDNSERNYIKNDKN